MLNETVFNRAHITINPAGVIMASIVRDGDRDVVRGTDRRDPADLGEESP